MLNNMSFCIPIRWFVRNGIFFTRAWVLEPHTVEDTSGWVVHEDREIEISQHQLVKNFPQFAEDHEHYQVPHPLRILGNSIFCSFRVVNWMISKVSKPNNQMPAIFFHQTHTNPILGNRWRALAKGHRTLALPLWLYCDDTSGNTSKKWNEHNSFLFTLAGLPQEETAKEYNVHFHCTSNLAPPLEMMDGVVSQIEWVDLIDPRNDAKSQLICRSAQKEGIWAWDCVHKELILVFPTVLTLLGDNPMHSEFACRISLHGKFFCHACWVKGSDAQDGGNLPNIPGNDTPQTSPAPSAPVSKDGSFENALLLENLPPPTVSVPLSTSPASNILTPKQGKYK